MLLSALLHDTTNTIFSVVQIHCSHCNSGEKRAREVTVTPAVILLDIEDNSDCVKYLVALFCLLGREEFGQVLRVPLPGPSVQTAPNETIQSAPCFTPGAATIGIAAAFRIPRASQAVGSLLFAKIKNPSRGFCIFGGGGGIRPHSAGRGSACTPNPSNPTASQAVGSLLSTNKKSP